MEEKILQDTQYGFCTYIYIFYTENKAAANELMHCL